MKIGLNCDWIELVSERETYWHHCGRCGSLFLSEMDFSEEQKCAVCGLDPAPSIVDAATPLRSDRNQVAMVTLTQPEVVRAIHHDDKSFVIFKIIVAWLLLIACIVLLAKWMWGDEPISTTIIPEDQLLVSDQRKTESDQSFLNAAFPECKSVLLRFLSTEVVRARYALVVPRESLEAQMDRYYQLNALEKIREGDFKLTGSTVVHLPEGNTILSQWETKSGHLFDAAFRLDGSAWKLDWDHFVRYGPHDWPLFCAGSGPEETEFRLLAREKVVIGVEDQNAYSVVLYAPKQMRIADAGFKAQMQPMLRESRDARMLRAAFKLAQEDKPLFGSAFRDINPQDMIRVRVMVRRIPGPGMPNFAITKVLACHWYASSAWGVDPDTELPTSGAASPSE